jgi:hypothetical protein
MRSPLLYSLIVLALIRTSPLPGQTASSRGDTLHLRITVAQTGRPLLRTWLNHWGRRVAGNVRYLGQPRGDMTGAVLTLVRSSGSHVEIFCERADGLYGGRQVAQLDSIQLAKLAVVDTTSIPVDAEGCDQRELAEKDGEWLGYYSAGFELSSFQWCGDTGRRIWVEYSPHAQARSTIVWPDSRLDTLPQYFVGFRGRLLGPFSYGHFGVSDYQLTVDSIMFARRPTATDCGR